MMKKVLIAAALIGSVAAIHAGTLSEDYTVSTSKLNDAPAVSNVDLAQTHYLSSSATGDYEAPEKHAQLFNGLVGNEDNDPNDSGEVQVGAGTTITVNFDLSDHTDGFEVWGIDTVFGWKTSSGGRANQGYSIQFTFVDNSTATIDAQHWEPNSPASYWTMVSFDAGASEPIASGVKSMTFTISEEANPGGPMVGREIDIFSAPRERAGYALVIEPPNGYRIPKILGATGDLALDTGYDYFDWYGFTEHRTWFKPYFSDYGDTRAISTAEAFAEASEAIRLDPWRQGGASDYYFDWNDFNSDLANDEIPRRIEYLQARGIQPMVINTRRLVGDATIEGDWESIFRVWRNWYAMVYYLASEYDITMYEFGNESHAKSGDYASWESHWLVAADAMRKAIDDVNTDYEKDLTLNICGPTCAGAYWDYSYPDPYVDAHGWGSVSWAKVKYDIYGNYDANNPWNYGSYDYHRYGQSAAGTEAILKNLRTDIANANNDPNSDIPIVITEYNTSTGGNFDSREKDTEDLVFGISMAPLLEASAVYGPEGLGDDGGIFIFKLGAQQSGTDLVGVGNKLSYASQNSPINYGGVTRGGACFQMYVRHFRGGKPLLPVTVNAGASEDRRTMAAIDEEKGMIYIYGGNVNPAGDSGTDVPVSIDLSAQNVEVGAVATLQRVDEYNTGQVTEFLTVDASNKLSFDCPSYTAFLIKVPLADTVPYQWELTPSEDTTQQVSDSGNLGAATTMNVSMHHSDAAQRNVGLLRYHVEGAGNLSQALLKFSGRNTGADQSEREIVHVYAVTGEEWSEESTLDWSNAPGLGQSTTGSTDGTGDMVDIKDNYSGITSGTGKGLGISGEFLGAVSFHSSDYVDNYLDVTDYLNTVDHDGSSPLDVTFVVARIIRYNVNEYSNGYYDKGVYHYDGRVVEIATKEHADDNLQPRLICTSGLPPVIDADDFAASSGVSVLPSSDVGGGNMVEFSEEGNSVSYEVRVEAAGTYLVSFRVASDAGSVNLELAQDGTPLTTLNRFVGAGETWTTIYKMVTLEAGFTTLTVSATSGEVQFLNWLELSASNNYFDDSVIEPVNVALNQPASASSVHSSPYPASKAFDGDLDTRWASKVPTPWLEVDLGEDTSVNGVSVWDYKGGTLSYEILVEDGGSWNSVYVGGDPSDNEIEWFPAVTGSRFRLQVLTSAANPSIREVELYRAPEELSTSMALAAESISFEWPNTAGATYAVERSTNLVTDSFSTIIESGIPALTTTNRFTVEISSDPSAFYRVIAE